MFTLSGTVLVSLAHQLLALTEFKTKGDLICSADGASYAFRCSQLRLQMPAENTDTPLKAFNSPTTVRFLLASQGWVGECWAKRKFSFINLKIEYKPLSYEDSWTTKSYTQVKHWQNQGPSQHVPSPWLSTCMYRFTHSLIKCWHSFFLQLQLAVFIHSKGLFGLYSQGSIRLCTEYWILD